MTVSTSNGTTFKQSCSRLAVMSLGLFSSLDKDIVAGIWPEERVVAGLRVCKGIRSAVQRGATSTKLCLRRRWKGFTALSPLEVCKDLVRFESFLGGIDSSARNSGLLINFDATDCCVLHGGSTGTVAQTFTAGLALAAQMGRCRSVVSLNLRWNLLGDDHIGVVVRAIGRMEQLRSLDLQGNKVGAGGCAMLAAVLGRCTALRVLSLRDNELGNEGAARVGCALGGCWWLEDVDLAGNKIRDSGAALLAEGIGGCSRLTRLSLAGNGISFEGDGAEDLSTALGQCETITQLDLSNNSIKHGGAGALSQALCGGFSAERGPLALRGIDLGGNSLGCAGWMVVARELWGRAVQLVHIDVRDSQIREEGATLLAALVVESQPWLERLEAGGNRIGGQGMHAMRDALEGCGRLTALGMAGNQLGCQGVKALAQAMQGGGQGGKGGQGGGGLGSVLLHLDLSHNGLEADAVTELIGKVTELRTLSLSHNALRGPGVTAASRLAQGCTALQGLGLSHVQGGAEAGGWAGQCLRAGMQWLDVGHNGLGVDGVMRMATALSTSPWRQLRRLSLRHNALRARGAAALAGALAGGACAGMTELDLSYNALGVEGAGWVGAGLKGCSGLERLLLSHNSVGDEGLAGLAEGLRACSALTELRLSRNKIRDAGAETLAGLLAGCEGWRVLDLSKNQIRAEGGARLEQARQRCGALMLIDVAKNKVPA